MLMLDDADADADACVAAAHPPREGAQLKERTSTGEGTREHLRESAVQQKIAYI